MGYTVVVLCLTPNSGAVNTIIYIYLYIQTYWYNTLIWLQDEFSIDVWSGTMVNYFVIWCLVYSPHPKCWRRMTITYSNKKMDVSMQYSYKYNRQDKARKGNCCLFCCGCTGHSCWYNPFKLYTNEIWNA